MIVRSSDLKLDADHRGAAPPNDLVKREAADLGTAIREARRERGLDQRQLAMAANVSPRTVFAIENGKPTARVDMVLRLLSTLGLKLSVSRRDRVWSPDRAPDRPR